jgi:hypothetical protein
VLRARRASHHVRGGFFDAQTQGGERVAAHVDRQDLDWRQWQRDPEQHERQIRDRLRRIVRQYVGEKLADVFEHCAPLFDSVHDAGEVVIQQHHVGRFLGHIRAGDSHRDADVRTLERRSIVHAVAGNRHHVPLLLQRLDDAHFLVGADPRKDDFGRVQGQP